MPEAPAKPLTLDDLPTAGKCTLNGQEYTWESPTLADLEEFEVTIGPVTDPKVVNSIRGRYFLLSLCLRKHHPDLTPGIVRGWPNRVHVEAFENVLVVAVPFWGLEAALSALHSSAPSSDSPDGSPAEPVASA